MAEGEGPKKIIFDNYDSTISLVQAPMDDLRVFKFKIEKPMNFIAGQYVSVILPGARPAPFSIASSPTIKDEIELGIEITGGPVTSQLKNAKIGDKAVLRGPFGTFVLQGEKKVCFLAGGVGVTPFVSMMRWIRDTQQDVQATLFYSCKVKEQILWMDELEEMTKTHTNLRVVLTLTRESPEGWLHEIGRINEQMIRDFLPDYAETTFYCCGPPALIGGMFSMLKEMGVPEHRLKQEKW